MKKDLMKEYRDLKKKEKEELYKKVKMEEKIKT